MSLNGIRLHDTRHNHTSLMLKQGVHPKIVQERLGYSGIQLTLDTYSYIVPGLQEAVDKAKDSNIIIGIDAIEKKWKVLFSALFSVN